MAQPSARLTYVEDSVRLLWPDIASAAQAFVVLPSRRVPAVTRTCPPSPGRGSRADALHGAAGARGQDEEPRSRECGVGRCAVRVAEATTGVRAGRARVHRRLPVAALGLTVVTTLAITAPRANRKPVLQVFDQRGRTLGFAKVGTDELTRGLVDHEADTLETLRAHGLQALDVPKVLHRGAWADTRVSVLSALPRGRRVAADAARTAARDAGDRRPRPSTDPDHAHRRISGRRPGRSRQRARPVCRVALGTRRASSRPIRSTNSPGARGTATGRSGTAPCTAAASPYGTGSERRPRRPPGATDSTSSSTGRSDRNVIVSPKRPHDLIDECAQRCWRRGACRRSRRVRSRSSTCSRSAPAICSTMPRSRASAAASSSGHTQLSRKR